MGAAFYITVLVLLLFIGAILTAAYNKDKTPGI
jgi:hypothetical protein